MEITSKFYSKLHSNLSYLKCVCSVHTRFNLTAAVAQFDNEFSP